jgi:isochorismate hydrolase
MKAIIIIDMLVRDMPHLKNVGKLIDNQLALITACNKKGYKVIIVGGRKDGKRVKQNNPVMLKLWGQEDSSSAEENKIIPALLNSRYDLYVEKREYSAFYNTQLQQYCKKNRISEIYLAGINSGVCVYFTGVDAAMRGIFPILVTDASATKAGQTWHRKNCTSFKHILGPVMITKEAIACIERSRA